MRHVVPRRGGFTIIELLVATALAILLLSIVVAALNSTAFDSYKVVGSGDRLSQYLLTAKNRALRDKAPRGVRLTSSANNTLYDTVQYIEQPEPWVAPSDGSVSLLVQRQLTPPSTVAATRYFLSGITTATFQTSCAVGDQLSVPDLGWNFLITGIATPAAGGGIPTGATVELTLTAAVDLAAGHTNVSTNANTATLRTTVFGVRRQARPLLGEPTLQLPKSTAVDSTLSLAANPVGGAIDVLFAPGGEVLNTTAGLRALLIRDTNRTPTGTPSANYNTAADQTWYQSTGEMVLVVIYSRTGAIGTQPVAAPIIGPGASDAYKFAKDGVNTGL